MPEQAGRGLCRRFGTRGRDRAAASDDPAKVRDALANDLTSGGGSIMQPGEVEFDANGASNHVVPVMIQWQSGAPHTVFPESVATSQVVKP